MHKPVFFGLLVLGVFISGCTVDLPQRTEVSHRDATVLRGSLEAEGVAIGGIVVGSRVELHQFPDLPHEKDALLTSVDQSYYWGQMVAGELRRLSSKIPVKEFFVINDHAEEALLVQALAQYAEGRSLSPEFMGQLNNSSLNTRFLLLVRVEKDVISLHGSFASEQLLTPYSQSSGDGLGGVNTESKFENSAVSFKKASIKRFVEVKVELYDLKTGHSIWEVRSHLEKTKSMENHPVMESKRFGITKNTKGDEEDLQDERIKEGPDFNPMFKSCVGAALNKLPLAENEHQSLIEN